MLEINISSSLAENGKTSSVTGWARRGSKRCVTLARPPRPTKTKGRQRPRAPCVEIQGTTARSYRIVLDAVGRVYGGTPRLAEMPQPTDRCADNPVSRLATTEMRASAKRKHRSIFGCSVAKHAANVRKRPSNPS